MCDINEERELYQRSSAINTDYKDQLSLSENGEEVVVWRDADDHLQVLRMNQLNKENSGHGQPMQCPDILMNISHYPGAEDEKKCQEKLIPVEAKEVNQGPWRSKELGELVPDMKETAHLKKRRRQRKLKKGLGWAFWIGCAPLAVCFNFIREPPEDPDDPFDWNNDPLRPWRYRVNLPRT